MYKAIIFDFFGVIQVDPYKIWLNEHGLKREGPYAKASDTIDMGLITEDEFHRHLSELSGRRLEEISSAFAEPLSADATLIELIRSLHGSYKIGLLSNSRGEYLRPILDRQGITDLFEEIIISSEVGAIKPDDRIFQITLGRMGLSPAEVIFIDDSQRNIIAAENLGINSILYQDLASLKEQLTDLGVDTL